MKVRSFRIPTEINLPGLTVKVYLLHPSNLQLQGDDGQWQYDGKGTAQIFINRLLDIRVQRYALLHELQHMMVDYLDQAIEKFPKLFKLKREIKRKSV